MRLGLPLASLVLQEALLDQLMDQSKTLAILFAH